jgi:hypothetical protein
MNGLLPRALSHAQPPVRILITGGPVRRLTPVLLLTSAVRITIGTPVVSRHGRRHTSRPPRRGSMKSRMTMSGTCPATAQRLLAVTGHLDPEARAIQVTCDDFRTVVVDDQGQRPIRHRSTRTPTRLTALIPGGRRLGRHHRSISANLPPRGAGLLTVDVSLVVVGL